jgi:Arc-like DNA binding domain
MPRRRDPATAQIGLRLREPLRLALEEAARARGNSMNHEIVQRLASSFAPVDAGTIIGKYMNSTAEIMKQLQEVMPTLQDERARDVISNTLTLLSVHLAEAAGDMTALHPAPQIIKLGVAIEAKGGTLVQQKEQAK